jgi:acetyltransferase
MDVIEDCAAKGVKVAQFFTAGFRELDADEGLHLEVSMLEAARRGGFRIIGPNCVGTCVPEEGKPLLGPTTIGTMPPPGNAAFASQSGGIAGEVVWWWPPHGASGSASS